MKITAAGMVYEIDEAKQHFRSNMAGTDWWTAWRRYDHTTPAPPEIGASLYIDHGNGSYTQTALVEGVER